MDKQRKELIKDLAAYSVLPGLFIMSLWWQPWSSGPPDENSRWGACYNEIYIRNHPDESKVDDPVYILGSTPYIREEVFACKEEFAAWIQTVDEHSDQYKKASATMITNYLTCRLSGWQHDECQVR